MGPKMESVVNGFFHIGGTPSGWIWGPGYAPRSVNLPRLQYSRKASLPEGSGYTSNACSSVKLISEVVGLGERPTLTDIKYLADTSYSIQNFTNTSHTRTKN